MIIYLRLYASLYNIYVQNKFISKIILVIRFNSIIYSFIQIFDEHLFSFYNKLDIICRIVKHLKTVYLKFWVGSEIICCIWISPISMFNLN